MRARIAILAFVLSLVAGCQRPPANVPRDGADARARARALVALFGEATIIAVDACDRIVVDAQRGTLADMDRASEIGAQCAKGYRVARASFDAARDIVRAWYAGADRDLLCVLAMGGRGLVEARTALARAGVTMSLVAPIDDALRLTFYGADFAACAPERGPSP